MLGTKLAARKMTVRSSAVIAPNLRLSQEKGLAEGKRRPSMLNRSARNTMGKTSMSSSVASPKRRKPKKLVVVYTTKPSSSDARTIGLIREWSLSSL
ncbi:hypothetical protein DAI22_09g109800 [Oryza sativa Japonica Group]|nr:hypothetical protein DAI22_09g109800 [Oryza sativa Japonica Group]